MPFNGAGVYTLPVGNPVVTNTTISSTTQNTTMSDVATALTTVICKDGQTAITANLPMNSYRHTGVGDATVRTSYASASQVQDSSLIYLTSVSGTDTITASASIGMTTYATGQQFHFISAGANTGAATININGIGAKSITKNGTTALEAGDIPSGSFVVIRYDGTRFQINSVSVSSTLINGFPAITTLESADQFAFADSSNSNINSKITFANLATQLSSSTSASTKIQPITASVNANALTVTLNETALDFRSSTITSGAVSTVLVSSPISVTISSGSTLGTTNGTEARLVVLAINNAGTVELAVGNITSGLLLDESGLISTTTEGGAGGADSANTFYSTTGRSNVAYRVVGYLDITEATAGTWASSPSVIAGAGSLSAMKTAFNAAGSAPLFACRAWVNFTGTGVVTINSSGNVSSITDNGTGDYTINFTTAMPSANYAVSGVTKRPSAVGNNALWMAVNRLATPTTSAVRIATADEGASQQDPEVAFVSIIG